MQVAEMLSRMALSAWMLICFVLVPIVESTSTGVPPGNTECADGEQYNASYHFGSFSTTEKGKFKGIYAPILINPSYTGPLFQFENSDVETDFWGDEMGILKDSSGTELASAANQDDDPRVKIWYDQSGNGKNLIQSNTSLQCKYKPNLNEMYLDCGGNRWMDMPSGLFNSGTSSKYSYTLNIKSATKGKVIFGYADSWNDKKGMSLFATNDNNWKFENRWQDSTFTIQTTNTCEDKACSEVYDGSSRKMYVETTLSATETQSGLDINSTIDGVLGGRWDLGGNDKYSDPEIRYFFISSDAYSTNMLDFVSNIFNDDMCTTCPVGTYNRPGTNDEPCKSCPAGKSVAAGGGAYVADCDNCVANTYSAGGTSCVACPSGQISTSGSSACVAAPPTQQPTALPTGKSPSMSKSKSEI